MDKVFQELIRVTSNIRRWHDWQISHQFCNECNYKAGYCRCRYTSSKNWRILQNKPSVMFPWANEVRFYWAISKHKF